MLYLAFCIDTEAGDAILGQEAVSKFLQPAFNMWEVPKLVLSFLGRLIYLYPVGIY